jgi:DNA-binding beta-propeller fold protein YncE
METVMILLCILLFTSALDRYQATLVTDAVKSPFATAFDKAGTLYFVEYQGHRLGVLGANNKPTYLAGTGKKGDRDGLGTSAELDSPHNLAIGNDGCIYVSDTFNHKIKKYDPQTKQITTFAGTGKAGFSGDGGDPLHAQFNETYHITFDPSGKHLYVVDLKNQRIRRIEMATNRITTVAGTGKKGSPIDGTLAINSPFSDQRALIVDDQGQLYILQRGGHDLWKVDTAGKLSRLAGTGKKGYSGDGSPAQHAQLSGPKHLCFDNNGDILIADSDNHCIRKLTLKTGIIELIAGRGKGSLPGSATEISLNQPHGVTVKPGTNHIYIADSMNNRIVKVGVPPSGGKRLP